MGLNDALLRAKGTQAHSEAKTATLAIGKHGVWNSLGEEGSKKWSQERISYRRMVYDENVRS